jgi:hypothetical protein
MFVATVSAMAHTPQYAPLRAYFIEVLISHLPIVDVGEKVPVTGKSLRDS